MIFASQRTEGDASYGVTAVRMVELAAAQLGYLGIESARGADGFGITVSYWRTLEDIVALRRHGARRWEAAVDKSPVHRTRLWTALRGP